MTRQPIRVFRHGILQFRRQLTTNRYYMNQERWKQIDEIFQAALALTPGERERYLEQACATDTDLRSKVETLLTQCDETGEPEEEPGDANATTELLDVDPL